ncbi:MAG: hypothetical protein RMJ98_07010, partial [Myxococcales bacterium]|nr:hypothetical protein [Myxococcales bacterium]
LGPGCVTPKGAPIPTQPDSGGFSVSFVGGQWIYEFPVSFTIDHDTQGVIDAVLHVNMFESFRWKDENKSGFLPKIFDVTPTSFEPVQRFGANSFEVKLSPAAG